MKALAPRLEDLETAGVSVEQRLDQLVRELSDIKRILVLLQHRTVIASLVREDEHRKSWARRLLGLFTRSHATA